MNQGPGINTRSLSTNDSEVYSLESVNQIPVLYYISFVDHAHCLWAFDIRSFGQLFMLGNLKVNPYTRAPIPDRIIKKILNRLTWLRARKYSILHPLEVEFTPDQLFQQKVLDLFMKIESLGYHVCCEWFHRMTVENHIEFYKTLYDLWNFRLGLTSEQRDAIVPGHTGTLFYDFGKKPHTKHWWEKVNLRIIEAFLTRSPDKEQHKLGAMYCIMAFVRINEDAADVFPWFS